MPLSEHEQRMLDQIEKALYAEDPKFAQSVRARDPRVHYRRRIVQAAIGFLIGVGLLLAGVFTKYIWMGVAGFLVMLTCAMWALTSWRHMSGVTPPGAGAADASDLAGRQLARARVLRAAARHLRSNAGLEEGHLRHNLARLPAEGLQEQDPSVARVRRAAARPCAALGNDAAGARAARGLTAGARRARRRLTAGAVRQARGGAAGNDGESSGEDGK